MDRTSVTIVTPPTVEPVTVEEMKLFLRLDSDTEDSVIAEMIGAARAMAEQYLRRALITQTLKLTLDAFPRDKAREDRWWDGVREVPVSLVMGGYGPVPLPMPPLQQVSSIVTYDCSDTASTLATSVYGVDVPGARVYLKDGQSWPGELRDRAAAEITYLAGYGTTAATIPSPIRLAIKQAVTEFYHSRDCGALPDASMALLAPYRVLKAA